MTTTTSNSNMDSWTSSISPSDDFLISMVSRETEEMGGNCSFTKSTFDFADFLEREDFPRDVEFYQLFSSIVIVRLISGSISIIASCTLMWTIFRSHKGLSETFERLLCALCICDVLTSAAHVSSPFAMPKDLDYLSPWVYGNTAACSTQGFFQILGTISGLMYNCSICVYYLAIVKYHKKGEFIRDRIEPWMHLISIVIPLGGSITGLVINGMNQFGPICSLKPYNPFHCEGCKNGVIPDGFELPCGRGLKAPLLFNVFVMPILIGTPALITYIMLLMYRAVEETDSRNRRYGAGSLRIPTHPVGAEDDSTGRCIPRNIFQRLVPCRKAESTPLRRPNRNSEEGKRNIFFRACFYNGAWAIAFAPFLLHRLTELLGVRRIPAALFFLDAIFMPLQGLFNFIIYMYPRVISAKQSRSHSRSWFQAFVKALWSRGERTRSVPVSLLNDFRQRSSRSSLFQSISKRTSVFRLRYSTIIRTKQNADAIPDDLEQEEEGITENKSYFEDANSNDMPLDESLELPSATPANPSNLRKSVRFNNDALNVESDEGADFDHRTSVSSEDARAAKKAAAQK